MIPSPAPSDPDHSLRRASPNSPWLALAWRVLAVAGLIGLAVAVHWFDRAGLRDNIDGKISFWDVVYFTVITVTTVGYGDIVPVTEPARLFDAFGLTPIRLLVWLIFLGTAYDFLFKRVWEHWRMSLIQRHLHDHVVVTGYGLSGAEAVAELIRLKARPEQIVVIDKDPGALQAAERSGVAVMAADATRNTALEAVQIARAKAVVVSAGRDDTSILIVLTARRLAPKTPISVVIRSADNEDLARQAGADTVINPASFAGLLLANSTRGAHLADYMADLAAAGGAVSLRERPVSAVEVGQPLSALRTGLGVRLYRDGVAHGFASGPAQRLQVGDLVIEVVAATDA